MNKTFLSVLALLLGIQMGLGAQGKNIEAGVKAVDKKQYVEAVGELNTALADADNLKDKALARAYYYRGKAKIQYLWSLYKKGETVANMSEIIKDYSLSGAQDLKAAKKHDTAEKLTSELKTFTGNAENMLIEMANYFMEKVKEAPDAKEALYKDVIGYCDGALEIEIRSYIPHTIKGKCYLGMDQKAQALESFKLADKHYFRTAPKSGNLSIVNLYLDISELELEVNNDKTEALNALTEGRERLNGEYKKIKMGQQRPEKKAAASIQYDEQVKVIDRLEAVLRDGE